MISVYKERFKTYNEKLLIKEYEVWTNNDFGLDDEGESTKNGRCLACGSDLQAVISLAMVALLDDLKHLAKLQNLELQPAVLAALLTK